MDSKNVFILINPVSGGRHLEPARLISRIKSNLPENYNLEIVVWEHVEDRLEIIQKIREGKFDMLIAAGGDGTINFVAQLAMEKNIPLGIIPLGSGNGLARHLGIPLQMDKAIKTIGSGKEIIIDTATINDKPFICVAGAGFDALIGHLFESSTSRGFITYARLTLQQLAAYRPKRYQIRIDDNRIDTKAFILTVANVNQYGNDTFIAPQAIVNDGYLDVCIIKPFKIWHLPVLGIRIFNKTIGKSRYYESHKAKEIEIVLENDEDIHYDGEPIHMGNKLLLQIKPASLKIIVPYV